MPKFRKKPVVIEAEQYRGNHDVDRLALWTNGRFQYVDEEDRVDDPDIEAEVFDILHSTWVGVEAGQWIIRGVEGEFYPCDDDVFTATYDSVCDASLDFGDAENTTTDEALDKWRSRAAKAERIVADVRALADRLAAWHNAAHEQVVWQGHDPAARDALRRVHDDLRALIDPTEGEKP